MQFGEVGQLGRPVVHLRIDVGGVIAAPGCLHPGIPDSLQVGGLAAGLRAADQQVAAKLEVRRHQRGVLGPVEGQQPVIDRPVLGIGMPQVQLHAVELELVGGHMGGQRLVVLLRSAPQVGRVARQRVAGHVLVVHEIGSQGDMEQHLGGTLHAQRLAGGAHPATPGRDPGIGHVADRARDATLVVALALHPQDIPARSAHPPVLHRRVVEELAGEGLGPGGRQAHDDQLVREGRKRLLDVFHAVHLVAGAHDRPVDVQLAAIIGDLPFAAGEADLERSGRLVVHLLAHGREQGLPAQVLGGLVLAGEDQFADLRQGGRPLGVPVLIRAARGDGLFVELEFLHVGAAVDHGADAAVADRPGLFPGLGRLVEPDDILRGLGMQTGD